MFRHIAYTTALDPSYHKLAPINYVLNFQYISIHSLGILFYARENPILDFSLLPIPKVLVLRIKKIFSAEKHI